ncbi:MAG: nucleotidyltransferase family protein [bacterium]
MDDKLTKLCISPECSIKEAMKQMDCTGKKILIVTDQECHLKGTVSDGDIRRFILKNCDLNGKVKECYNKNPAYLSEGDDYAIAKRLMIQKKIETIPVVDKNHKLVDLLIWNHLFNGRQRSPAQIKCPVVIMAGGKGERLAPFTRILPKPLIPIGEKPILELIMDNFSQFGVRDFYLTVNYKAEMIKSYFDNIDLDYNLTYIREEKYLGTAGSLRLLPPDFPSTFILSNCDVFVQADYADLLEFHKKNKNDLTMIGAMQRHVIPYGLIEFSYNGFVKKINEKPEYDYVVNTGVYVIEKKVLEHIQENTLFHITHLMDNLLKIGSKIGVYPVSEQSYMDIGQWEEYKKNVQGLLS